MVKIRSPRSSSVLRALFTAAALRPDHARFLHFVSGGSAGGGGPSASASSTSAGTAAGAGGAAYPLKGPLEITTPTTSTTTPAKLNVTECTADLFGSERAKIYCGNCRAVSKWAYSATVAHTCNDFCHSFGLHCTDAYDDLANSCAADGRSRGCAYEFRFTDDAICQCATWKQLEEREKEKTHPSADHLHNGAEQHGGLEPVLLRGSWVYREFFDANCRVPTTVEARGRIDDTCFPETMKSSKKLTTCGLTHAWYTYYPDTVDCGGKKRGDGIAAHRKGGPRLPPSGVQSLLLRDLLPRRREWCDSKQRGSGRWCINFLVGCEHRRRRSIIFIHFPNFRFCFLDVDKLFSGLLRADQKDGTGGPRVQTSPGP